MERLVNVYINTEVLELSLLRLFESYGLIVDLTPTVIVDMFDECFVPRTEHDIECCNLQLELPVATDVYYSLVGKLLDLIHGYLDCTIVKIFRYVTPITVYERPGGLRLTYRRVTND